MGLFYELSVVAPMSLDQSQDLGGTVRNLRIILFALVNGCLIFVGIVLFLRFGGGMQPNGDFLITPIALGACLLEAILQAIIPEMQVAAARRRIAAQPPGGEAVTLLGVFRSRTIVGAAMCESGALFAVIAYMIEGHAAILIAALLLVVLILARWPSEDRVRAWLVAQYQKIAALRVTAAS